MKLDFSKILDNCQDAFVILKGTDEVVYQNPKAQSLFADAPVDLASGGLKRVDRAREATVTRADGSDRVFRIDTVQTYSHEEPLALLLIRDVTREKRLSEDNEARLRQEALNRLKNELISVVSHEMRTPLAIVKSSLEALNLVSAPHECGAYTIDAEALGEKRAKIAETALRNVDRLGKLVEDFLDLSRLESGVSKIRCRKTDPRELLEKCAAEISADAGTRGLNVSLDIPESLPPIPADPGLFAKALRHVLHNALRYAKTSVTIRASSEGRFVKVTVADDGPGIPKEHLDGIFEKFAQHGRPAGGSGYLGTGLGLTLANEIMTSHQGEIAIGSVPGGGTEVHLLVPQFDATNALNRELGEARHRADADQFSFSLLSVVLNNFSEMSSECARKDVEWTLNDMTKNIHRILRADDRVLPGTSDGVLHVLLTGSDRKEAFLVNERIRRVTKDCFCPGRKGRIFVEVLTGIAVYPDDTADLGQLVAESLAATRA